MERCIPSQKPEATEREDSATVQGQSWANDNRSEEKRVRAEKLELKEKQPGRSDGVRVRGENSGQNSAEKWEQESKSRKGQGSKDTLDRAGKMKARGDELSQVVQKKDTTKRGRKRERAADLDEVKPSKVKKFRATPKEVSIIAADEESEYAEHFDNGLEGKDPFSHTCEPEITVQSESENCTSDSASMHQTQGNGRKKKRKSKLEGSTHISEAQDVTELQLPKRFYLDDLLLEQEDRELNINRNTYQWTECQQYAWLSVFERETPCNVYDKANRWKIFSAHLAQLGIMKTNEQCRAQVRKC